VTDPNARLLQRQLFAGAFETELDRQGRVLVPQGLRTFAGLDADALVLGNRDHAEVWAPARWDEYSRSLEDPTAFAQAIAGLGI
jgi:MraZ protein